MDKDFKDLTVKYALDPENAELNFDMAFQYHARGHTASAFTHYLRCAERADDDVLAYEALCRGYFCFVLQGRREFTAIHLLKQAQVLLPRRPEAYWILGMHYTNKSEHAEAYVQFELALQFCDFDLPPLRTYIGYKSKPLMMYQKAKAAWEWDKNDEARDILSDLMTNYWHLIEDEDKRSMEFDINRIGIVKLDKQWVRYFDGDYKKLKYKFPGSEKIVVNGSQAFQDMFILYMHQGKKGGTYLEIGSGDPYQGNNTALLEENYGWKGVGIENMPDRAMKYKESRKNIILFDNALTQNYSKILNQYFPDTKEIDYLQLDIEPCQNTFECLLSIPFDEYKFAVLTYEHDYYIDFSKTYRDKSRRYLKSIGYELVVADVSSDGKSNFEDWWVHPDLINKKLIDNIKHLDGTIDIKKYFLGE